MNVNGFGITMRQRLEHRGRGSGSSSDKHQDDNNTHSTRRGPVVTTHPDDHILARYNLGEATSITALSAGYSNENYRVETGKGVFLYRVCKKQGVDLVRRELEILDALAESRFPAAYPIRAEDDRRIHRSSQGPVVLFQFIEGEEPEVNPETAVEAARAVALLNAFPHWERFRLENELNIDACIQLIDAFDTAPRQYPDVFDYFAEQTDYLREPLSIPAPEGLIHGDVFPDNTIFKGSRLAAVIDFENACTDKLVYDVGMTINGFCFPGNKLSTDLLAIFLNAYTHVRPLSDLEYDLLPCYMQMGAHAMVLWHLKYDLLNHHDERQLARVHELVDRVRELREAWLPDLKHLL